MQKINESVQDAETTWNDTNDNLRNLRDKYQRAVILWQKYRESSDVIKNWADDQMNSIGMLQPLDANDVEVKTIFI